MRPKSSCPASPPSRARSGVISPNSPMSAPTAKTNGLPVRSSPRQSRVRELVEHVFERAERRLAERVRLLPVLAVVHRHERDRADARLDLLELELRLGC